MNKEYFMKNRLFLGLTPGPAVVFMVAAFLFGGLGVAPATTQASEAPLIIPVAVAESENFELVGRLEASSFVFFVDRAASNAPVLNATLEVEQGGRKAIARFRSESGDYLIDDAAWLAPLRQPGEYALAFTLLAGEEADLLTADFVVLAASTAPGTKSPWGAATALPLSNGWAAGISGLALLLIFAGAWRRWVARKAVAA